MPLIVVNIQRGGPSTGMPTSVEQSDLMQAIYGSHGDTPRVVLAPKDVEDCFYLAIEAGRIAREYSTPVLILSDQAIATRIEAFAEPDLPKLMGATKPDVRPRDADYKPYPLDRDTHHAPPGSFMASGKYPNVTGLEHDEHGHPSASPAMHTKMMAKRREKLKKLGATLPAPELGGDTSGDVLLVGWGCTYGPIREAMVRLRGAGAKVGHMHMRHINPLPEGLEKVLAGYKQIVVVEINDEGLYGFGQLATLLRARYANPAITSITKTDGLTYKVSEIVERTAQKLGLADTSVGMRKQSVLASPQRS